MVNRLTTNKPYTGSIEEASPSSVDFLDVCIILDPVHGKVHWAPHLKDSSLRSVLSIHSSHPSKVHESWMRAYCLRLMNRSSSTEVYRDFQLEVFRRLHEAGIDQSLIAHVQRTTVMTYPVTISLSRPSRTRQDKTFWCVCTFHPVWFFPFE